MFIYTELSVALQQLFSLYRHHKEALSNELGLK